MFEELIKVPAEQNVIRARPDASTVLRVPVDQPIIQVR